jgi:hypothetical protein
VTVVAEPVRVHPLQSHEGVAEVAGDRERVHSFSAHRRRAEVSETVEHEPRLEAGAFERGIPGALVELVAAHRPAGAR